MASIIKGGRYSSESDISVGEIGEKGVKLELKDGFNQ